MRYYRIVISIIALAVLAVPTLMAADNSDRIYGRILTVDGEEFEGLIRWDKNEGSWVDVLNGNKEIPKKFRRKAYKESRQKYKESIKLFGLRIGGSNISWDGNIAQSGMRFGHIKSLEVVDDDAALIVTQSGLEVELEGGSTDIGTGIREIVIEDKDEGEIELDWDDIEKIEFMGARTKEESTYGERLYGTLLTRRGEEYSGAVCWDVDELFPVDILDGDDKRRSRKVKFGKIASIERYSSSAAKVVLKNGDEQILRGSNDVDDSNRGIVISDPGFGQVKVYWDEFDRLDFTGPVSVASYDDFDGGKELRGTVYTEDGEEFEGTIRWDNDVEYTWEILDGEFRDVEFDVEFSKIQQIEKRSRRSTVVTVWDGRSFRLSGSNDVDDDNKGIFIMSDDGDEELVEWEDFAKVVFVK